MKYYKVKDDFYFTSKTIKPISLVKDELLTKREYEKLEIFTGKEKIYSKSIRHLRYKQTKNL